MVVQERTEKGTLLVKYQSFPIEESSSEVNITHYWYCISNKKGERIAEIQAIADSAIPGVIEVQDMFVEREYRKNGLATKLMHRVVEAHGDKTLKLFYMDEEELGIDLEKFYQKFGFKRIGKKENQTMRRVSNKE